MGGLQQRRLVGPQPAPAAMHAAVAHAGRRCLVHARAAVCQGGARSVPTRATPWSPVQGPPAVAAPAGRRAPWLDAARPPAPAAARGVAAAAHAGPRCSVYGVRQGGAWAAPACAAPWPQGPPAAAAPAGARALWAGAPPPLRTRVVAAGFRDPELTEPLKLPAELTEEGVISNDAQVGAARPRGRKPCRRFRGIVSLGKLSAPQISTDAATRAHAAPAGVDLQPRGPHEELQIPPGARATAASRQISARSCVVLTQHAPSGLATCDPGRLPVLPRSHSRPAPAGVLEGALQQP